MQKKIFVFTVIGIISVVIVILAILGFTYVTDLEDSVENVASNESRIIQKPTPFDTNNNETEEIINATISKTSSTSSSSGGSSGGGGSSGSSGGGETGCSPSLDCEYYYNLGECGNGLFDGCSNSLNCLSCLDGEVCVNGSCVAEAVSWDDYISYWKFDGDANDSGPGGNDGSIFGDAYFVDDVDRGSGLC